MAGITPYPTEPVRNPILLQSWSWLTFLHWRYDPELIQSLLPPGLRVDLFEDTAWVGLTPFQVRKLRLPQMRSIPWISSFPETNVRTYVLDEAGNPGVWFFSLDADRLAAVVGARTGYRLPYQWAQMRVQRQRNCVVYRSRRNGLLSPAQAESSIEVEPGELLPPHEIGERELFLTARWRLYTTFGGRVGHAQVEHAPWPLCRARVLRLEQTLITAAGLPQPAGDPLVHYSENVDVRVGAPVLEKNAASAAIEH